MGAASTDNRFQHWLAEMDDAINRFIDIAPADTKPKLDFSDQSLESLESWLLAKYADPDQAAHSSQAALVDGAARYVGEIFRARTDSHWSISFTDPKAVFYGLPTLQGGRLKAPLCPLALVTSATDRRTGRHLRTVLRNVTP